MEHGTSSIEPFTCIELLYNGGTSDCWQADAVDPDEPYKRMIRCLSGSGHAAEVDLGPGTPVKILILNNSGRATAFRMVSGTEMATVHRSGLVEDMDVTSFKVLSYEQRADPMEPQIVRLSSSHGDPPFSLSFSGR